MRRPVKPFVTEYRGPNRRQAPQAGLSLKGEDETTASPARFLDTPRQVDGHRFNAASQPSEDSYEAALRAADALFSGAPAKSSSPTDDAAASGWAHSSASADTMPHPFSDATEQPFPSRPPSFSDERAPAPTGGRILRAIDEEPSPDLARLETETAPKRRGRKPGSKNKPKVALTVELAIVTFAPPEAARPAPAPSRPSAPPAAMPPAMPLHPQPTPAIAASKARAEPFAWVRTKLKPGEQWKRRLPKVAW